MNIIKKRIKIPLYNHLSLVIIISDDVYNASYDYIGIDNPDKESNARGVFISNGGNESILSINPNQKSISDLAGIVSHEALHATNYIMDFVGMKLSSDSEESYTYLLQYIVEEVMNLVEKYKIKYGRE